MEAVEKKVSRVCVVSPLYHPTLGGLGKQAQLLTERLAREGVKVFVIARRMKGMPPAVFSPGVKVFRAWSTKPYHHTFENISVANIVVSLTFSVSCAFLLVRHARKYDIAHYHSAGLPLFITLPLLKLMGKKVVAKVAAAKVGTEAGAMKGRYFGLGTLIAKMLRTVDAYVATTAEIEEGLMGEGIQKERINRITNFVDFSLFSPPKADTVKKALRRSLCCEDAPTVLFTGRFIPRKGIGVLLEAWEKVVVEVPGAKLLMLGDGMLLPEMKEKAESLAIADSAQFLGHVDNVADFLRTADIYVFPSLQEGMPNALLEAMACGLPAIASRIGGVVDVIRDGENGLLVTPADASGLAEALVRLLRDGAFRRDIGTRAYETIRHFYTLDAVVPAYTGLYRRLSG